MPVYCYKCNKCNLEFEARHSMSYESQKCIFCHSSKVFKIPSLSEIKILQQSQTPGKIVDKYIEDVKKEVKKEKKKLLSREL